MRHPKLMAVATAMLVMVGSAVAFGQDSALKVGDAAPSFSLMGSRRDALRHARWMLLRLTRLYGQGETPHLPL